MDIENAIRRMDAEIATRSSEDFGIKAGIKTYLELHNAGHISMEKFSVLGTGTFELEFPAYKKKFAVCVDLGMAEDAFDVGKHDQ